VSDTGTGITEDDLSHIFDPYFTTKASGTGLGLAIVYNIMEAHGGEIAIESRLGQGTEVTIFFLMQEQEMNNEK
jgi:signal transduction histidine kinase